MNEKTLIKNSQHGDRQAFDTLIRLHYDYVAGFLLKTTTDEILPEDLTQETFLKMIRNIDKFDPGGSAAFGTWLITIAKNCYIDHLRRNRIYLEEAPDIEEKCRELQAVQKERLQTRVFTLLCAMVAVIPALLIFAGISLTMLIAPLVFMSLSVILLLPVLLSGKPANQGGIVYEQA